MNPPGTGIAQTIHAAQANISLPPYCFNFNAITKKKNASFNLKKITYYGFYYLHLLQSF